MNKRSNPLVNALGNFFVRAVEGAAEAVLDETQNHLHEIGKKVKKAKNKIHTRRVVDEEELIGEVIDRKEH